MNWKTFFVRCIGEKRHSNRPVSSVHWSRLLVVFIILLRLLTLIIRGAWAWGPYLGWIYPYVQLHIS